MNRKVNILERPEFERSYDDVTDQCVSHCVMETLSSNKVFSI